MPSASGGNLHGMEHAFGRTAPFTVGIEEEFQLVSAESYELVPRFDEVAEAAGDERVRRELMTSVLETATGVHTHVAEAMAEGLTPPERERLTAQLRPQVEQGLGEWRMACAYLVGRRLVATPDSS